MMFGDLANKVLQLYSREISNACLNVIKDSVSGESWIL